MHPSRSLGLTEQWIRWLLTRVSAEVHYGGVTDPMSEGPLVNEDLLVRCRAAWDALPVSERT